MTNSNQIVTNTHTHTQKQDHSFNTLKIYIINKIKSRSKKCWQNSFETGKDVTEKKQIK